MADKSNMGFDKAVFEKAGLEEQRQMISDASKAGGEEAINFLIAVTDYRDGEMRFLAKRALNHLGAYTNERFKAVDGALNANIAGKSSDKHIKLDVLEKFLTHQDYQKRLKAVQGAHKMGDSRALPLLVKALKTEKHPFVRASLVKTIGKIGGSGAVDLLVERLDDPDPRVRANTVEGLSFTREPRIINKIVPLLKDSDNRIKANAAKVIAQFDERSVFEQLEEMISLPAVWMRASAAYALGEIDSAGAMDLLEHMADSEEDEDVLTQVIKSVSKKSDADRMKAVLKSSLEKWTGKNMALQVLIEHSLDDDKDDDLMLAASPAHEQAAGKYLRPLAMVVSIIVFLSVLSAGYWWLYMRDQKQEDISAISPVSPVARLEDTDGPEHMTDLSDRLSETRPSEEERARPPEEAVSVEVETRPSEEERTRPPEEAVSAVSVEVATHTADDDTPVDEVASVPEIEMDIASILQRERELAPADHAGLHTPDLPDTDGMDITGDKELAEAGITEHLSAEALAAIREEIRQQVRQEMSASEQTDEESAQHVDHEDMAAAEADREIDAETVAETAVSDREAVSELELAEPLHSPEEKATIEEIGRILEAIRERRPPREREAVVSPAVKSRPRVLVIYPVNESFSDDVGVLAFGIRDMVESSLSRLEAVDVIPKEEFLSQLSSLGIRDRAADIGRNPGTLERIARILRCDWIIGGTFREVGQNFDGYLHRYIRGEALDIEVDEADLSFLHGSAGGMYESGTSNLAMENVLPSETNPHMDDVPFHDRISIESMTEEEKITMAERFYRVGKSLYDRRQYQEAYKRFYVASLYASDLRQVALLLEDARIKLAQSISAEADRAKQDLQFEITLEAWEISGGQRTKTRRFFGPMRDIGRLMRESVLSVITAAKLPISDAERTQVITGETSDIDAFVRVSDAIRLVDIGESGINRRTELQDALKLLDDAISDDPSYSRPYMLRALVEMEQGFSDRAISSARRAVSLDPRNIVQRYQLVNILERSSDSSGAAAELREITRLKGPEGSRMAAQAHTTIAGGHILKRERGFARDELNKALAASPEYPYAHLLMGRIHFDGGNFQSAISSLRKALELENRDPVTHLLLARVFERQDLLRDASISYHNALNALNENISTHIPAEVLRAAHPDFDRYDILFSLGEVSRKTGYISLAREFYQQVISGRPLSEKAREARQRINDLR